MNDFVSGHSAQAYIFLTNIHIPKIWVLELLGHWPKQTPPVLSPLDDQSCTTAPGSNKFQDLPHEAGSPRAPFHIEKRASDSQHIA